MPPRTFCADHTALVKDVGELRGDVKGLGKSLDTLRTQTQSSFREAALKADERHRDIKQTLNGKVKELAFDDDERTGEIQIVKQKVEKIDRWRYGLYAGGIVLLFILTPLVGKLWDLIIKAFGG